MNDERLNFILHTKKEDDTEYKTADFQKFS